MAEWTEEPSFPWAAPVPGNKEIQVSVARVYDKDQGERDKIILKDHPQNPVGARLDDEKARTAAVQSIAEHLDIRPKEADWFVLDKNMNLHSVKMGMKTSTVPHEEFTAWHKLVRNDYTQQDYEEVKKQWPDQKVKEPTSFLEEPSAKQIDGINRSFGEARLAQDVAQSQSRESSFSQQNTNDAVKPRNRFGPSY